MDIHRLEVRCNFGLLSPSGWAFGFQSDAGYLSDADITIVIWGNNARNGLSFGAIDAAEAMDLIIVEE